jgi:hypothetical protein
MSSVLGIEYEVFIPDNTELCSANLVLSNVTIKCNYSATRDVKTMSLISIANLGPLQVAQG